MTFEPEAEHVCETPKAPWVQPLVTRIEAGQAEGNDGNGADGGLIS